MGAGVNSGGRGDFGPWVVVVTGPPAGGKTTLARGLAPQLGLPLVSKDDLKEILFETLGWGGAPRNKATSMAAYELMLHLLEQHLQAGMPLMLESNFRLEVTERLAKLLEDHNARVVQVRCFASRKVLIERIGRRAHAGTRHPGHCDRETVGDLEDLLASGVKLGIGGLYLEVDTTPGRRIDREDLVARIRSNLSGN